MSIAIADVDIEVTIVVEITSRYRRCERHDLASPWTLSLSFEQDMEEWIMMKWYTIGIYHFPRSFSQTAAGRKL